jgi:hypothetical protein
MQTDVVARRVAGGLQTTLRRLATLVGGLTLLAFIISAATFTTGWWVFHGTFGWLVVGGLLCLVPVAAATLGWLWVHGAARLAPRLIDDVTSFLRNPSPAGKSLIDYDSGQPITMSARSVSGLKADLEARKNELPGLWIGIRTITAMPGIAATAVVGMSLIGALGTVLFLVGLFR